MPKSLRVTLVWALTGVALLSAGAQAQGADESLTPQPAGGGGHAGVDAARNQGIAISAEAAEIMADAPAGGCLDTPTRDGCPAVGAVVAGPVVNLQSERTPPIDQCAVRAEIPEAIAHGSNVFIRGTARNQCTAAAAYQEIYATVRRYQDGAYKALAVASSSGAGGMTISATATYDCDHHGVYAYSTQAFGYAVVGGIGYAQTQNKYHNWTC